MSHLIQLRTFLETYRSGSLSRAAQRLGMTQPAASAHVRALETTLGKSLFSRQARGMTPTPIADELARSIAIHLDELEGSLEAMKAHSMDIRGTLHLAGPAVLTASHIAPLLAPLMAEGISFRIQTGGRETLHALLREGAVDLAITASVSNSPDVAFEEFARERLVLVAAPDMARRILSRKITRETLEAFPAIAYDEELPLIREFFQSQFGVSPVWRAQTTAPDLRIVDEFVRAGAGWSVLPDYFCQRSLNKGQMVALLPPASGPEKTLYLAWNKSALRHPRVAFVRDHLLAARDQIDTAPY
ncbi:LysR family transcriptional regulator [Mangrovitalea sediminis]|uniref:LysR family transcriptional regulator n=1 Tax=Mangrovitalea sediminis TaxID=1982043 RepID=UPI000BE5074A|nr:LysR family transcriptional regulator [Mangrovitalea sediminis]